MFETLLGLVMIYTWVHSVIIVAMNVKGATQYEKVVLILALTGFILYLFGTL
jgi:hypothetical protein